MLACAAVGDLGPAFGAIVEVLGPLVGTALRTLLRTTLGVLLFGCACLGLAAWWVIDSWRSAALLLVPGLLALVVLAGVLAAKNAVLRGAIAGLQRLGLGGRLVRAAFSRLGVADDTAHGERAGTLGRVAERVPLQAAEQRFTAAVAGLLAERAAKTGVRAWLARRLMATVLERVSRVTLARFRQDEAQHGGVDLTLVRDELGGSIDGLLAAQLAAQLNRLNLLAGAGYALLVTGLALLAQHVG